MGERAYRELPKPCKRSEMLPGLCDTHNCWAWSAKSEVCLEYRAQAAEAKCDELDYDFKALSIHAKALVSDRGALQSEVEQLRADKDLAITGWAYQMCWTDGHDRSPEVRPCEYHRDHVVRIFEERKAALARERKERV